MNTSTLDEKRGNPFRFFVWGTAAFLLLLPAIAMQFTSEVNWDRNDFIVFGLMLLVACGIYEMATRRTGSKAYRLGAGLAVLASFLIVWVNGAVGIIGNESNPANIMFYLIPPIALLGALLARFKPAGMAKAMVATALAQACTAIIAFAADWGQIWVLTAVFVMLWLISAHLFNKASQDGV